MKTLDLHNVRHKDVVRKVEDFLSWEELPVKIITGNSERMKELVIGVVKRCNLFCHYENLRNSGCLIVTREDL